MNLKACPDRNQLDAFLLGQSDDSRQAALEAHIFQCHDCSDLLQTLVGQDTLTNALKNSSHSPPTSAFLQRLMDRLKSSPPTGALPPEDSGMTQMAAPGSPTMPTLVSSIAPESRWLLDILTPAKKADELGYLGNYRILKILGKGGMGAVLLAEDYSLQRMVALKVLLPEVAVRQDAKDRFLREARVAARIEHDNIVNIFQVGEDRGVPYIAMQLLRGEPLDEWFKARKRENPTSPVEVATILRLGREMAQGLGAAHALGLVHRDIKPANIWLDSSSNDRVKILDFGLARDAVGRGDDEQLTQTGTVMGTPAFMSPEQARGQAVDRRCDLFSLGSVMYLLATGQLPFKGNDTMAILTALAVDTPKTPSSLNPRIPPALDRLILKLLQKDPADRYATADLVADDIRAIERNDRSASTEIVAEAKPAIEPLPAKLAAPVDPWADIEEETEVVRAPVTAPVRGSTGTVKVKQPPTGGGKGIWIAAAAGAIVLLAMGIVFFVPTKDGTIRVEIDDPDIEVAIKGTGIVLKKADKGTDVAVTAGEQTLKITRGDFTFDSDKFVLKRGEKVAVRVELLGGKVQVVQNGNAIGEKLLPKTVAVNPKPKEPKVVPKPPSLDKEAEAVRELAVKVIERGGLVVIQSVGDVTRIQDLPKGALAIVRIAFQGEKIDALGDRMFDGLTFPTASTIVQVNSLTLTDSGLAKMPPLVGALWLKAPKITDVGLAAVVKVPGIRSLELSSMPLVTGTGFGALGESIDTVRILSDLPLTPEGLASLCKNPRLKNLSIASTKLTPQHFRAMEGCPVESLDLNEVELTDELLKQLPPLESLRELTLQNSAVTSKGLEGLRKLKNLERLFFDGREQLQKEGLEAFAVAMPKVQIRTRFGVIEPTVSADPVRELAVKVLERGGSLFIQPVGNVARVEDLPKGALVIVRIILQSEKIDALGDRLFDGLTFPTEVSFFQVGSATLTDAGLEELKNRPGANRIVNLSLNGCPKVTDAGFAHVAGLTGLKDMSLTSCPITGTGFSFLKENIRNMTPINCKLSVAGFAAMGKMAGLRGLNLESCEMTAEHLEGLVGSKLEGILLANSFDDAGVKHLTRIESLRDVNARRSKITSAALDDFRKLKNLEQLHLELNPQLEKAAIEALAKAMPKVKIVSDFGTIEPTVSADPVRELAVKVLERGGLLFIRPVGNVTRIQDLPEGALAVDRIILRGEKIDALGDRLFDGLTFPTEVPNYQLGSATLTDAGLEELKNRPGANRIVNLSLNGCPKVTDAGLAHVAGLTGLKDLNLTECPVTGTGFAFLKENVRGMTLIKCKVSVAGFAAMGRMAGLRELNIENLDATAEHFEGLVGLKLERIYLPPTFADAGLKHLVRIESLRYVAVKGSKITPAGLDDFRKLKNLEELNLELSSQLEKAAIEALAKAMPKVKIVSDFGTIEPSVK